MGKDCTLRRIKSEYQKMSLSVPPFAPDADFFNWLDDVERNFKGRCALVSYPFIV